MDETQPKPATRIDTGLDGGRGDLSQPPADHRPTAQPRAGDASGFDFNHPTVVSLCYLASFLTGVTAIVGVVLAYVWRGESGRDAWEESHFTYLINTFWIGLVGSILGFVLLVVVIGILVLLGVAVLVIVRCVLSLVKAQRREPMPNPTTWFA